MWRKNVLLAFDILVGLDKQGNVSLWLSAVCRLTVSTIVYYCGLGIMLVLGLRLLKLLQSRTSFADLTWRISNAKTEGTIVDGGIYSNAWSCMNNNNIKFCIKTKQKMRGPDPTPIFVTECCLSITVKMINYNNNQYDAIMTSSLNVNDTPV